MILHTDTVLRMLSSVIASQKAAEYNLGYTIGSAYLQTLENLKKFLISDNSEFVEINTF